MSKGMAARRLGQARAADGVLDGPLEDRLVKMVPAPLTQPAPLESCTYCGDLGDPTRPRNTRIAWFKRRIPSSSSTPTRARSLDLGTVVILSTMRLLGAFNPFRSFGCTPMRNSGASVGSVVKTQMVIERVASKLLSWMITAGLGLPV